MRKALKNFMVGLVMFVLNFGLVGMVSANPIILEPITISGTYIIGEGSSETTIGTESSPVNQGLVVKVTNSPGAIVSFADNIKTIYTSGIGIQVNDNYSILTIDDNFTINAGRTGIQLASSGNQSSKIIVGDYLTLNSTNIGVQGATNAMGRLVFGDHTTITTEKNVSINSYGAWLYIKFGDYTTITTYNDNSMAAYDHIEFGDYTKLITYGKGSYGAQSYIDIGNYLEVYTYGENGFGLNNNITVGDYATIVTKGKNARGVANNVTLGDNAKIKTIGDDAIGAFNGAKFGENATIETSGNFAYGAYSYNDSGLIIFEDGAKITTKGYYADALVFGGTITKDINYNNVKFISELANLIGNDTISGISVIFNGTNELYGNLYNYEESKMVVNFKDNTNWEGRIESILGSIEVNLFDNASWTVNGNSALTKLGMSNKSSINFSGNNYYTLTIDELNEIGTDNSLTLSMRVNMSEEETGDQLFINKAKGEFDLKLFTSGTGEGESFDLIIIEDGTNFDLNYEYEYGIGLNVFEIAETKEDTKKIFTLKKSDKINPIIDIITASSIGFIQTLKAMDDIITLEKINKNSGLYGIANYKIQSFKETPVSYYQETSSVATINTPNLETKTIYTDEFKQELGSVLIGYNVSITDKFNLGIFLGSTISEQKFTNDSRGKITSNSFGIMAIYDNNNVDLMAYTRWSNNTLNYQLQTLGFGIVSGETKAKGFTANLSASYNFKLENDLILKPFFRIFYNKINPYEYNLNGSNFTIVYENGLQYYVGIGVVKSIQDKDNKYIFRLDTAWIRNSGTGLFLLVDNKVLSIDVDKDQVMINAGFDLGLNENSQMSFDLNVKYGKLAHEFGFTFSGSITF